MPNVFYDQIIDFQQYDINLNDNIFNQILETRKNKMDSERFFLRYISEEELSTYDFNSKDSLKGFRDVCCSFMSPLKGMAGCNLRPEMLERDIRYAGIILSDQDKKVLGQFDVRNGSVISVLYFHFFMKKEILLNLQMMFILLLYRFMS